MHVPMRCSRALLPATHITITNWSAFVVLTCCPVVPVLDKGAFMMDFTKNLLHEWGLSSLVDHFVENEIDEETFLQLTEKDIEELIPILGRRKKFCIKYNQYMIERAALVLDSSVDCSKDDSNVNSYTLLDETSSNASSCSTTNNDGENLKELQPHYYSQKATLGQPYVITKYTPGPDETVRALLDSTEEGTLIKNSYGPNKKFLRNNLCNLIIKNEFKKSINKSISTERFKQLAQEINDIFIHESPSIYYLPYTKGVCGNVVAARGKLWSTYTHQRQILRNGGLLTKKQEGTPKPSTSTKEDVENNEKSVELLAWLNNNSEPFPQVLEYWKLTAPVRLDFNIHALETIDQYFKKFPLLNKQCGHILLDSDFNYLFPDKENCLFIEWPKVYKHVYSLLKQKSDSYLQELLAGEEDRHNPVTDDIIEIVALKYLPLLFQSPLIKTKVKQHWKPSKQELLNGFILFIDDIGNLQNLLDSRQTKYKTFKLSAQPIPVVVGTYPADVQCFVSINDVLYKLDSPLKAVDLCFKSFHALHASYPVDADPAWSFIQKGIYKITTNLDKRYSSVDTAIANVQRMQENS